MKISDEEVAAAIDAWFSGYVPTNSDYTKEMRDALKAALRVRKKRKRERDVGVVANGAYRESIECLNVRGTGRTTNQLLNVKRKGVFVCNTKSKKHVISLCQNIGRADIEVVGLTEIKSIESRFMGSTNSDVIFDHWFYEQGNKYLGVIQYAKVSVLQFAESHP